MRYLMIAMGMALAATPAQAKVVSADSHGFEIVHEKLITGSPTEAMPSTCRTKPLAW